MSRVRSSGAIVASCLLAIACGSRSDLSTPPSGSGGAPSHGIVVASTGAGAATTTSGSGAGPVVCSSLQPQATVRSFDTMPDHVAHAPQLTFTNLAGTQATLVVQSDPDPFPIDATGWVTQVTFEPWGSWSAAPLGTELRVAPAIEFAIPRTRQDGLSVWLTQFTQVFGPRSVLVLGASPFEDIPPAIEVLDYLVQPLFITESIGGETGYGYGLPLGGGSEDMTLAAYFGATPVVFPNVSCTSVAMRADGMRLGDRFLAAYAQSDFGCDVGSRLAWGSYRANDPPVVATLDAGPIITQIRLAPRSDGAWLVWQTDVLGSLWAMRLDDSGAAASSIVELVEAGMVQTEVGVSTLGDDLAIIYRDNSSQSLQTLSIFDADGVRTVTTSYAPPSLPRADEPLALLGSPDGRSLLLAWSAVELDTAVAHTSTVYAARFDCGP